MPSINISEDDFNTIACAAKDAKDDGNSQQATRLDKIARKINAALTATESAKMCRKLGHVHQTVRWQDMPSTIEDEP